MEAAGVGFGVWGLRPRVWGGEPGYINRVPAAITERCSTLVEWSHEGCFYCYLWLPLPTNSTGCNVLVLFGAGLRPLDV